MRWRILTSGPPGAALTALAVPAPACGGGENEARKPTPSVTTKHAAQDPDIVVSSGSVLFGGSGESKPVLVPNLPGLTVVGRGEAKGAPDGAILRFTIGSGDQFPGPGGVAVESIPIDREPCWPRHFGLRVRRGTLAYFGSSFEGCQALRSLPPSFLESTVTEGTPHAVKVAVTLQATFAFESD